jgi:hypothetical protein
VHAESALLDDVLNLRDSGLASVIYLQRTASDKSQASYREYDGIENGFVGAIKRAVDEDVVAA